MAYLIQKKKAKSQTVRSYVSAMRSVLQDNKIELYEDKVLLSALTQASKLKNNAIRTHLPIQKNLLLELLKNTNEYYMDHQQPYLARLYQAMFSTAYFGLFRICEIMVTPANHAIAVTDVHVGWNKQKILFILRTSKTHNKGSQLQMVKISTRPLGSEKKNNGYCPYELLRDYINIRLKYHCAQEPFFIFRDRSPVTAENFHSTLRILLAAVGFDATNYSGHSFRIGRSSDLMKYGVSVETIKKLGR